MNDLNELHEILSRERLLLERMLFRVVSLRNLAVGGHARFLAWASEDVEHASGAVSAAAMRRDAVWANLSTRYQLPTEFSFDALLSVTTEPMTSMLSEVRQDIAALTVELRHHLALTRDAAADGLASASEVHARLAGMDLSEAVSPTAGASHVDARL